MKSFLIAFLLLLSSYLFSQSLEFSTEQLTFSIDSVYFSVNGSYQFRNNSLHAGTFSIIYPIPLSQMGSLDTLIILDDENQTGKIPYLRKDSNFVFQIQLRENAKKVINVTYKQKHRDLYAIYILTTTRYWGKPLEEAHYDLIVPDYLEVTEFSYPPDNYTVFSAEKIYHWDKVNFMPDKDFHIRFVRISKYQ